MQRIHHKYTTTSTMEFDLGVEYSGAEVEIKSRKNNNTLAHLSPKGVLTVYPHYSWDGCSPKFAGTFLDYNFVIGAWDGVQRYYPSIDETCQSLKYPSLVHDVLCQMYHTKKHFHFYTRRDIDVIFCNMMKLWGVPLLQRKLYYWGVRGYAKVKYRGYE